MTRTTILAGCLIFGLIGAAATGLTLWKRHALAIDAAQPKYEPATTVDVVTAKETIWIPSAELVGTVLATQWVNLSVEVGGIIRTMTFDSGAIVEKDQILIQLDDSTEQANLSTMEASVRSLEASVKVAEARLHLAEADMRRLTEAVTAKAAVQADLDKMSATLDEASASKARAVADVEEARTKVQQVRTMIAKKVIKAPFRGRVGLRNIHPGQYLKEGENVVMLQAVGEQIYLDFAIPQEYVARVAPGMKVMATSPVLGPAPIEIKVTAIDATVDNNTRNVRVRSIIENRGDTLRPGMFINVRVPSGEPETHVVVPVSAVRRASYADHVFIIGPGKEPKELRATQRFIKLGPTVGDQVIVLEGLKSGEQIAAAGSFKLRDGALVMLPPPAAQKVGATPPKEAAAVKSGT